MGVIKRNYEYTSLIFCLVYQSLTSVQEYSFGYKCVTVQHREGGTCRTLHSTAQRRIVVISFPWVQIAYKCGIKSACLYNTGRFPSVILCSTSFWHLYSGFCKQRIIPLIIACRAQCHTSTIVQKQKSILVTYV